MVSAIAINLAVASAFLSNLQATNHNPPIITGCNTETIGGINLFHLIPFINSSKSFAELGNFMYIYPYMVFFDLSTKRKNQAY
ncbi:MAG: hypothetical protein [Circular genetic element sp.]|nr:MAG: hypothetical protein [Circular genetic element sp.]